MAQVLKESVRNRILESAKQEFLSCGYENASMRNIALKCGMTVGNLYRYFSSKETLVQSIVSKVFDELSQMVKELTNDKIEMLSNNFILVGNFNDLKKIVKSLSKKIVDIYFDKKEEFNILMMRSQMSEDIVNWFTQFIYFTSKKINNTLDENQLKCLSKSFSSSIVNGVKQLFYDNNLSKEELSEVLDVYLSSYLNYFNKGQGD